MRRWMGGFLIGMVVGIALAAVPLVLGSSDATGSCVIDGVAYDLVRAGATPTQEGLTATPTPGPSATATPSPTILPSMTPTPTATGTPDARCWGIVAGPLNVRDAIWGNRIGLADDGQMLALLAYGTDSAGDRWYRIWWEPEEVYGWVHGDYITLGAGSDCSGLIDETATVYTLGGAHVLPGEGGTDARAYVGDDPYEFTSMKCLTDSFHICLEAKAANPELFIIARTLIAGGVMTDCPAAYDDPAEWWAAIRSYLPAGFDAYEVINECPPPAEGWDRLAQWSIEMAQLVERDTGGIMLAFSFGPGNPEFDVWRYLVPYMEWSANNPTSDGRYHGIAVHASPFGSEAWGPWVNNDYITPHRMQIVADILRITTDFDLAAWPGRVHVTEIGLTGGYSGVWRDYECDQIADSYRVTLDRLREYGYFASISWWNFGKISIWLSDHRCLEQMTQ